MIGRPGAGQAYTQVPVRVRSLPSYPFVQPLSTPEYSPGLADVKARHDRSSFAQTVQPTPSTSPQAVATSKRWSRSSGRTGSPDQGAGVSLGSAGSRRSAERG